MRFSVSSTAAAATAADLVVFPVFQKDDKADLRPVTRSLGRWAGLERQVQRAAFTAKAEALLPVWSDGVKAGWVMLAGMGTAEKAGLETIRRTAARAAARAREMKAANVLLVVPDAKILNFDDAAFARCWVEGAELALSPVGELKTGRKDKAAGPRAWKLMADAGRAAALRRGAAEAGAFAAGCLFARDLVNLPGNHLTPRMLAQRARAMARREGLSCEVLGPSRIRQLKMGGLLGVSQGSAEPPQLITLQYKPRGKAAAKAPHVALVGKGVTFDAGGISLKPAAGMEDMKTDMGGAAAVLGAALTAARLQLPVRLTVIVPATENLPSGTAVKPADVITMASGKTVEVLNTDAEGRLILADALWYAARFKPDHIIDAATLTGACAVALGSYFAGLMSNSAELTEVLRQAGGETFERVWPLPLVDEHRDEVQGAWSDLKNLGNGRDAGASTAAAFLSHFVADDMSWAHLDIAGAVWTGKPTATCARGATGYGARLIARALQILGG